MGGFIGVEQDYVLLKNLRVELTKDDGSGSEEANGCFTLCFWLFVDSCPSFPSVILEQKHPDNPCGVPFLRLDEKGMLTLLPLLFLHQEAPYPDSSIPCAEVPSACTGLEFPMKKWVHIGCEIRAVTQQHLPLIPNNIGVWKDLVRLHIDGEIVGETHLKCVLNNDSHADAVKRIHLSCPDESDNKLYGYVHGLDVLFPTSDVKTHYRKDPPLQLSIDQSSASEIEEETDGTWSIVGGKASCRRIFSLDVPLLDAFGSPLDKDLEVVASLVYADTKFPVENTSDAEPPLLIICDGIEYASHDRPCKLIHGCASFKLKISQLSSKCENKLFRIRFSILNLERYPFLGTISRPIHCVSRYRGTRTATLIWKKASNRVSCTNGRESPSFNDGPMGLIPNIVSEAKPSPSSKRIKLGNDTNFLMVKYDLPLKQTNYEQHNQACASNEDCVVEKRPENNSGAENSSASDSSEATHSDLNTMTNMSSPISDVIIFKYCLGSPTDRCLLLKDIATSACEQQLTEFAKQVSLFSGCLHHRHQINISKRLVEEGMQTWILMSENTNQVLWKDLVVRINEWFMKLACCTRSLTDKDLECLRRIAGCQDLVSQENFERVWYWLYPVALTLSQSAVTLMWVSLSPMWMEGFITKEEAESALQVPGGGLQDPGTFVLRFPTSRSWPHPDAGNLVVTYVGSDYAVRHRLLSLDIINRTSKEIPVRPLQDMLLEEPELSRLGRRVRNREM